MWLLFLPLLSSWFSSSGAGSSILNPRNYQIARSSPHPSHPFHTLWVFLSHREHVCPVGQSLRKHVQYTLSDLNLCNPRGRKIALLYSWRNQGTEWCGCSSSVLVVCAPLIVLSCPPMALPPDLWTSFDFPTPPSIGRRVQRIS